MAHYFTALNPSKPLNLLSALALLLVAACAEDPVQEITPATPELLEQPAQQPLGESTLEDWGQLSRDFCPGYLDDFAHQARALNDALKQVPEADSRATLETAQSAWRETMSTWAGAQMCIASALPETTASDHQNRLAWIAAAPAMAGFIDAVPGYEDSGLVHDENVDMTLDGLIRQHQITDDAEVAVGLYALEMLLFGIEHRNRADFGDPQASNNHHTTRRSQMLLLLGDHLLAQAEEWQTYWQQYQPDDDAERALLLVSNNAKGFSAASELASRHDLSQPGLAMTAEHDAIWIRGWLEAVQPWWDSDITLARVAAADLDTDAWTDLSSRFSVLRDGDPDWAGLALRTDNAANLLHDLEERQ